MFLWTVEGGADFHGGQSHRGGQGARLGGGAPGQAENEDAGAAANARVRDCDAHRANQQGSVSSESGIAVSGISPLGARGLAGERMAGNGEQPPREILSIDGLGTKKIEGGAGGWGGAGRGG